MISLWPRGTLDISAGDVALALRHLIFRRPIPKDVWPGGCPHEAMMSVRSAWDALLSTRDWPRGSEIIVSQINITPMFELIEHHGFRAVPTSIDPQTLQLDASEVASLITPRTRAILVAPLFGSRIHLEEIGVLARQHDLLLVEDGAQMFDGSDFRGSPDADITFFSFGLLKTSTALGGAVVFARDKTILADLKRYSARFQRVSNREFLQRWTRAMLFHFVAHPLVFGLLWRALTRCGVSPDRLLNQSTRGFGAGWLRQIRRRPHPATLHLLHRRLHQNSSSLCARKIRGREAQEVLKVLGRDALQSTFWLLPISKTKPDLIARARDAGFDLANRSSLVSWQLETLLSRNLDEAVFLPITTSMPLAEWNRLLELVKNEQWEQ